MKKLFLPISILTIVMVIAGILIFQTGTQADRPIFVLSEFIHVGIIVFLFVLGIYFWVKRVQTRKQGFPEDDELSQRVVRRASAISFYGSLFLWLGLLVIFSKIAIEARILFSYGFAGMALIFVVSWSVINYCGIKDE